MGHQHCFEIACSHCTVERYYGAPTLLQHCQQSLHGDSVLGGTNVALILPAIITLWSGTMGTNTASTLPTVIALWHCTTGHQHCFNITHCHHMVEWYYRAPELLCGTTGHQTLCHCTVEQYYWAPTLHCCHCTVELYYGAPTWR